MRNVRWAAITVALALSMMQWGAPSAAKADEANAKSLLKAMSDYMAAQNAVGEELADTRTAK